MYVDTNDPTRESCHQRLPGRRVNLGPSSLLRQRRSDPPDLFLELSHALTLVDLFVEGMHVLGVDAATHTGLAGRRVADPVVKSMAEFCLQATQAVAESVAVLWGLGA